MLNLYVVGCGGIGGYLTEMLPMAISSLSLDMLEQTGTNIEPYLANAGNRALPCIVDSLTLIDGDTFNPRNALRQGCGAGSKLVQRMRAINDSMLRKTFLQNMKLKGFNSYVNPLNVGQIIPHSPGHNADNTEAADLYSGLGTLYSDCPVVFLCVDNAKTRYELSRYATTFSNILVINGGNEKTTGHVTVYERRDGVALDPNLYEIYADINDTSDVRPDEAACTTVAPKHDQIAVTNSIVANVMMAMFNKWVRGDGLYTADKKGNRRRKNEVLIDTESMSMAAIEHPVTK